MGGVASNRSRHIASQASPTISGSGGAAITALKPMPHWKLVWPSAPPM